MRCPSGGDDWIIDVSLQSRLVVRMHGGLREPREERAVSTPGEGSRPDSEREPGVRAPRLLVRYNHVSALRLQEAQRQEGVREVHDTGFRAELVILGSRATALALLQEIQDVRDEVYPSR